MKKLKVAVNQCFISTISDYAVPFINYYNKWNTGNVVNGHEYSTDHLGIIYLIPIYLFKFVINIFLNFFYHIIFVSVPK